MILIAEDTLRTDGLVLALGADFFWVDEHRDVLHHKIKGFGHWFAQSPRYSS